jgi:mannose-6-phosphate isomerase
MLSALTTRLIALKSTNADALSPVEDLILRLNEQYPADIGVFSPLFTNYVRLQPGQSFFIGANELHAYISGECVECMALSDNVVRAGLTPKLKDCETLCKMLAYKYVRYRY